MGKAFKFNIDKKFLDTRDLTCSVPQGSNYIRSPTFFIICTDMLQAVKCELFLYAGMGHLEISV